MPENLLLLLGFRRLLIRIYVCVEFEYIFGHDFCWSLAWIFHKIKSESLRAILIATTLQLAQSWPPVLSSVKMMSFFYGIISWRIHETSSVLVDPNRMILAEVCVNQKEISIVLLLQLERKHPYAFIPDRTFVM